METSGLKVRYYFKICKYRLGTTSPFLGGKDTACPSETKVDWVFHSDPSEKVQVNSKYEG